MDATETRFLELVRRNEPRLRRIARVYAADDADVEDLYQETLMQLWRSLPTFRGEAGLDTWVYRVALNTALGQQRRHRSRREEPLEPGCGHGDDTGPGPEERIDRLRRLEWLYAAIAALPELDRALILMYLDDFSYRKMAEVMGLSESNVGVRLHRIRKRLEAEMAGTGS